MSWLEVATVLYVLALAGGTGCGAFLRAVRLRHEDPTERAKAVWQS